MELVHKNIKIQKTTDTINNSSGNSLILDIQGLRYAYIRKLFIFF